MYGGEDPDNTAAETPLNILQTEENMSRCVGTFWGRDILGFAVTLWLHT